MSLTFQEAKPLALKLIDFINKSPTPFHVVDQISSKLSNNGFLKLSESKPWNLKHNGKYYFSRNNSSIIAFTIGGKYKPGNGFKIIGTHSDSPGLIIKPNSTKEKSGYMTVGVQIYGGGLFGTWFDRDLTIAGRVIIQNDNDFEQKLIHLHDKTLLNIPSLAIHLSPQSTKDGSKFNLEDNLEPMFCTITKKDEENKKKKEKEEEEKKEDKKQNILNPLLLDCICEKLSCKPENVKNFELFVVGVEPATIGGLRDEFIFAPRMDNLISTFIGLESIMETQDSIVSDEDVRVFCCFDNEEVGSRTFNGAESPMLLNTINRINLLFKDSNTPKDFQDISIGKSFFISADNGHAVHPNYSNFHEENHKPIINKGVIIEKSSSQSFANTSISSFIISELAQKINVPLQYFVTKNDSRGGTTIGPIVTSKIGLRGIDIGVPELGMHSIRETAGTLDISNLLKLMNAFFHSFRELDNSLKIDG